MADVHLDWHEDFRIDASGRLMLVDGRIRGQQRIIRRLMTILGGYLWHLDYGASVPQRIGDTLDDMLIASVVRSQIFLEAAVARDPDPVILVTRIPDGVFVRIIYEDADSGEQVALEFEVAA